MNYLLLINKIHGLDKNYVPKNLTVVENRKKDHPDMILVLDEEVHKNFNKMIKYAFVEAGFDIICDSAYRTYEYQKKLYDELTKEGKETSKIALPGHSEHQTGLALDIAAYQNGEYVDNPEKLEKEYAWLHKNCHRFGFILRYPLGKESITGYPYEPWHFRYVGEKHAKIIMKRKIALEEYLKE